MKKKIIVLSHWRFPSDKTMSPLIMKTCEGFVQEGFLVELWVPERIDYGLSVIDPFVKHNIPTRFPIRKLPSLKFVERFGKLGFILMVAIFNFSVFFRLFRERKSDSSIIIYGQDIRDFVLPSLLGLPLFIEIHDFYESSVRFLNRMVLKNTSGLIVTNTFKQRAINERYGFPKNKMIHQPNAVSSEMFDITISKKEAREKLGLPLDVKIALYTGHLFSWKGVHTLAEAALYVSPDTYIYFVGGMKEDREALEKFVMDKKLPHIVFLPHQEHSKIPLFQKSSDVLVLPNTAKEAASKYETSPVKLFEYMASGIPIVASNIPSIREIVSPKEVFFFTPDDPKSLAKAIQEAIEDLDKANERTDASRILARSFSWPLRAKAITALIRRLV